MNRLLQSSWLSSVLVILTLELTSNVTFGQLRPNLGTASTYAIFTGGGAINNTGLTVLTGDVGQDGAYSFNGFPPGTYTGALNRANGASALAKADLLTAWTTEAAVTCGYVLGVGIVDGQSFDPAVYCSGAATTTSGNITFNAHGNANAIFIVKIGGQLDANSGTHILLANNARAANIYWFVDGAVNVANNSTFKGTIFARGAISFAGGSSLDGRALVAPLGAITLSGNNMAISTDSGAAPNITVTRPTTRDSIRGGFANDTIRWTGTGIARVKTLQYSLDSGLTWTTIATITTDSLFYKWSVPDTFSTKAMVRVTDTANLRGVSGAFVITSSKIILTHPLPAAILTGGALNYQITWTGVGLTPKKTIEYSLDSGLTWRTIAIVNGEVFAYGWNIPDTVSKKVYIRITDSLGITGKSGLFTIKSGRITVLHPALAEQLTGGTTNYQITWSGAGLTTKKTFEYSLDSGATWRTIGILNSDLFAYGWNAPDTTSTRAFVRITDTTGITGMSGMFSIKARSLVIVRPAAGETILGGTPNYQITWTGFGLTSKKTFDYSLDGGQTWTLIGTISADVFAYAWLNVPDTTSPNAQVRITDSNGFVGKSSIFKIVTSKIPAIIVSLPAPSEIITGGTQGYRIAWTGNGIASMKTFSYSLNNGLTWTLIGSLNADVFNYSWNVPDSSSTTAMIRIVDGNGLTGKSGIFTIKSSKVTPGSIVIMHPIAGEVLDGGLPNFQIQFNATNTTTNKTLEYSLDGGIIWNLIGFINSDVQFYTWASIPNVATTSALVRITDGNGVRGVSGLFTIKVIAGIGTLNSLTLSNLDTKRNIGNNKPLGIAWTFTPDIGTSVNVEYSLDYTLTWTHIATVQITDVPSLTWTTPMTGNTNPAFIRVTSTKGMTLTSAPFSIGSSASVYAGAAHNGYSISNYPNPASSETTIDFTLPVGGDVTLVVNDAVGREMMVLDNKNMSAGTHSVNFDASNLASGVYSYRLIAGSAMLVGKMNIVR